MASNAGFLFQFVLALCISENIKEDFSEAAVQNLNIAGIKHVLGYHATPVRRYVASRKGITLDLTCNEFGYNEHLTRMSNFSAIKRTVLIDKKDVASLTQLLARNGILTCKMTSCSLISIKLLIGTEC